MTPNKSRKKLIEAALPLEAINKACAREKMPGIGAHPRGLHLWWARRPLAAARAVIFCQMVDDPSGYVDVLRADAKLKRKAESALKAKLRLWEQARALAEKSKESGLNVQEPGPRPTLDEMLADTERQRLFRIIEDLVLWENTTNEMVLQQARDEIWNSWRRACVDNVDSPRAKELFDRHRLPAFHDPFAGGGALPLEAQRLGLEAYASDLNPVAVLINKAMIEIPPRFAGRPPVHPDARKDPGFIEREWRGAQGMAEDIRYYGEWIRDEAERRLSTLYPPIEITDTMAKERPDLKKYVGRELPVIAWLWARTVKSPNPAFTEVDVPLASTFMLSTKAGKEAYVEPVIENGGYRFRVKLGKPQDAAAAKKGTKLSRGANFRCLMSGTPIAPDHIYGEASAGRMGARLMVIVAEGDRGRVYLAPTPKHEAAADGARPDWKPELRMPDNPRWFSPPLYGLKTYGDLFTSRQLVALTTLSDLVQEALSEVQRDAISAGVQDDGKALRNSGSGATAYGEALAVYLSFAISRLADFGCTLATWKPSGQQVMHLFTRQAVPMTWDYPESNFLGTSSICWHNSVKYAYEALLASAGAQTSTSGVASMGDAAVQTVSLGKIISTDPPYYDNIGYADLSDFFYVWLRRPLRSVYPDLFTTLAVPKAEELVATPYRHGGKEKAETFFLQGMTEAMHRLAEQAHPAFPVTIYYAFKQSESSDGQGTTNTGWDTFLAAVFEAGFGITGTWPMRSEQEYRMLGMGTNALASSIVLVCRPRAADAPTATRREFAAALKSELPQALANLQRGNIAPVDLAQAAIGPGMAVYTRYSKVLDAAGEPLTVRDALALINQTLDEALAEQEGDFDSDSRWALTWFEEQGFSEGEFGKAETLATARNTSISGLEKAGVIASGRGKVRLLKPSELPENWDPGKDDRLTNWETVHHLIRVLEADGEGAAGDLAAKLGAKAETARELCYRLYTLCERKKRAAEAMAYNGLVQSWPEIMRLAQEGGKPKVEQEQLFDGDE